MASKFATSFALFALCTSGSYAATPQSTSDTEQEIAIVATVDVGQDRRLPAYTGMDDRGRDTIHVAPPTGEAEADRGSILAALEQVQPGGTVQFAAGTYLVGPIIRVDTPGITLLGHSKGTVLRGCELPDYEAMELEFSDAFQKDGFEADLTVLRRCGQLHLTGGHVTVRAITFEQSRMGVVLGCCEHEQVLRSVAGGYVIEDNVFRNTGNSVRAWLRAEEPTVIRRNEFINTFHALSAMASRIHFVENRVSVPEPSLVPFETHPGFGITIGAYPAQMEEGLTPPLEPCVENVIAGNVVQGHPDALMLFAAPGFTCRDNEVRDNTLIASRVPRPEIWRFEDVWPITDPDDPTFVGLPLRLWGATAGEIPGVLAGDSAESGKLLRNRIAGNIIRDADGLGMLLVNASTNQIVGNSIAQVRVRDPFPGNDESTAGQWEAANGSGIWVSSGSDENEITGNVFADLGADAIFLEGDHNLVETHFGVRDLGTGNRVGAPPAAEIDTRMVEVDGFAMRVQTGGWHHRQRGQPFVVFENGAGTPLEAWEPVLGAVAEFAPVIAYDRPGLGQSEWDEQPPTLEHVNSKLRSLLATLGAEPPYVMVGFSWGGPLIQDYAGTWPDEVAGMVFIDSPVLARWKEIELAAFRDIGVGEAGRKAWYDAFLEFLADAPPGVRAQAEVIVELIDAEAVGSDGAAEGYQVPVAVLVATRHTPMPPSVQLPFDDRAFFEADRRHTLAYLNEVVLASPEATLVLATHAGHYIHGDDPNLVIEAVRRVSFPDVTRQLRLALAENGTAGAVDRYRQLRRHYPPERFQEGLLNSFGYELLRSGAVESATAIFELNVAEYLEAANPHDSLGDAYSAAGRLEDARTSYRKAVQLAEASGDGRLSLFRSKLERAEKQELD
jgi:pimeloyl-ACP methyl ester carboxylesterase